MLKYLLFYCLLALSLVLPGMATAQPGDAERAKELCKNGATLQKGGLWGPAIEAYQSSLEVHETWQALFSIGTCYFEVKRYADSVGAFKRLLDGYPDLKEKYRLEAEEKLEEAGQHVGTLVIDVDQTGVTVTIDGRIIQEQSPISRFVDAGEHLLSLYLEGYATIEATVQVGAGQTEQLAFVLTPTEGQCPPAEATPDVPCECPADETVKQVDSTPSESSKTPSYPVRLEIGGGTGTHKHRYFFNPLVLETRLLLGRTWFVGLEMHFAGAGRESYSFNEVRFRLVAGYTLRIGSVAEWRPGLAFGVQHREGTKDTVKSKSQNVDSAALTSTTAIFPFEHVGIYNEVAFSWSFSGNENRLLFEEVEIPGDDQEFKYEHYEVAFLFGLVFRIGSGDK